MTTERIYLYCHFDDLNTEVGVQYRTKHLSAHLVSANRHTYHLSRLNSPNLDIFPIRKNFHKLPANKTDCLSWYISDASFVIVNYLSKIEIKGRDRGKHATYLKMIQTWVRYEVVKVLYIHRLNPEPSKILDKVAPDIGQYIQFMTKPSSELFGMAKLVQELLFKNTRHSGTFSKCNFSGVAEVTWKDDVKFMIPFLFLTWLRQLQQFFKKKHQKHTWSVFGDYTLHPKYTQGEGSNPLAVVYLSKPKTRQTVKVKKVHRH
jgi:hypothetical protein